MSFLNPDGTLRIVEWGYPVPPASGPGSALRVDTRPRSTPMAHTTATADPLVTNGQLGVDLIRVPAGGGFAPHTHPGDHLLIIAAGEGTITYEGHIYPTRAGEVYMVEGATPHGVGAITDHVILAVGAPHKAPDDPERMELVAYAAVTAHFGRLHCLACYKTGTPEELEEQGCGHAPLH